MLLTTALSPAKAVGRFRPNAQGPRPRQPEPSPAPEVYTPRPAEPSTSAHPVPERRTREPFPTSSARSRLESDEVPIDPSLTSQPALESHSHPGQQDSPAVFDDAPYQDGENELHDPQPSQMPDLAPQHNPNFDPDYQLEHVLQREDTVDVPEVEEDIETQIEASLPQAGPSQPPRTVEPPIKTVIGRKRRKPDPNAPPLDPSTTPMSEIAVNDIVGRPSVIGPQLAKARSYERRVKRLKKLGRYNSDDEAELASRLGLDITEDGASVRAGSVAEAPQEELANFSLAPQLHLVNGVATLDPDSLRVSRQVQVGSQSALHMKPHYTKPQILDGMPVVNATLTPRRINSATWSKQGRQKRWTDEETDEFYDVGPSFLRSGSS